MQWRVFEKPVTVLVGLGMQRRIRTVLEAAAKHRDLRLFNSPGIPSDEALVTLDASDLKAAVEEILSF